MSYGNIANLGDTIRAYDSNPANGKEEYVEGRVFTKDSLVKDMLCYGIRIDVDTIFPDDPRTELYIPYEIFRDYDGRIIKIKEKE